MLIDPQKDMYSIVFIIQDTEGTVQDALHTDVVSVFFSTTPNPTSGYLLFVPKNRIIDIVINTEEALKLIIIGGTVSPKLEKNSNSDGK